MRKKCHIAVVSTGVAVLVNYNASNERPHVGLVNGRSSKYSTLPSTETNRETTARDSPVTIFVPPSTDASPSHF